MTSPSPSIENEPAAVISREVARIAAERLGTSLHAVLLTGSMARGEASLIRRDDAWDSLGDAEFFLVLVEGSRRVDTSPLQDEARDALKKAGVACRVDLATTTPGALRALRPNIFSYELRQCGQVVWGDPEVLDHIPDFRSEDVPREDGWRLVSNRIVEMLEWPTPLPVPGEALPRAVAYRALKLCLDTATGLLLARGLYAPTYRRRAEQLRKLAPAPAGEPLPFALGPFSVTVEELTRVKLGDAPPRLPDWTTWRSSLAWALALWDDEISFLSGGGAANPDEALGQFARSRSLRERGKGWLAMWHSMGALRGLRLVPRVARFLTRGTPRYRVYGVATELARALPTLLPSVATSDEDAPRWRELRTRLPLPARESDLSPGPAWQKLAEDVLRHYRTFLVGTRA